MFCVVEGEYSEQISLNSAGLGMIVCYDQRYPMAGINIALSDVLEEALLLACRCRLLHWRFCP